MFNLDQVNALCAGLAGDVRVLGDRTESLRGAMETIRNDNLLSEAGKALNLKPLEEEAANVIEPLRADIEKREVRLAEQEAAWEDPVRVMLSTPPPLPPPLPGLVENSAEKRMRSLEGKMEALVFAQQVAMATGRGKQILLNNAVDADRWDLAGMVLNSATDADREGGFQGLSTNDIRAKFSVWREGRARLAMARAAIAEARLRIAQTEKGYNPVAALKLAHQVQDASRAAGIVPPDVYKDALAQGLTARAQKAAR